MKLRDLTRVAGPAALVSWLAWTAAAGQGDAAGAALFQEEGASEDKGKSDDGADAGADKAEEEEEDRWYAIVGGDVHTGTGAVLRGATVLGKNGKIEEIGYDVFVPEEAEVLDATGFRVYPGLVAVSASSRITRGMFAAEDLQAEEGDGHDHGDEQGQSGLRDPLHPDDRWAGSAATEADASHADDASYEQAEGAAEEGAEEGEAAPKKRQERPEFEDTFDPFSGYLVMALSTGITTLDQSGTAAKLKRGEIDGVAMKEKYLTSFSWSSSGRTGLREKFQRATEYLRELELYEEKKAKDKDLKEPDKKGVDSSVIDVLEGRKLAKFNADERSDLLGIARFAQTYRFRPVIEGCREGWTVAEELGRAGAYAIVTPRDRRPKDERLVREGGSSIENAALLHKHGVQVAIIPSNTGIDLGGITGRDLLHFPVEAGFAVRGGMSDAAALAGITLIPARLLGVDHRVGSLEVGKDMDAIVTDGDVLHYQTFVQWTVVDGKLVYDKQKELLFHHIRPRAEPVLAEEPQVDAAAEEVPAPEEAGDAGEEEHEEEGKEKEEEGDEGSGEGAGAGGDGAYASSAGGGVARPGSVR